MRARQLWRLTTNRQRRIAKKIAARKGRSRTKEVLSRIRKGDYEADALIPRKNTYKGYV